MGFLGSWLIGSEESFQTSLQCFLAFRPHEATREFVRDHSVGCNEDRGWNPRNGVRIHHVLIRCPDHRVVDVVLFDEGDGVSLSVRDIHADKLDATRTIDLVETHEERRLRAARHTPRSPEVQDDGFAAQGVKRECPARVA
jgi:hypothetical protein